MLDMTEITTQEGRDQRTGRFLPGNSGNGGRPKGARSKLSEQFLLDLSNTWNEHGPEVLTRLAKEKPAALLQAMVALMPRDVNLHTSIGVNVGDFSAAFTNALSLLHGEPLRQVRTIEHADADRR